ncbi:MAG TPA: FHA domain-containing serine/threonine-protein kinase [Ktedonobacteraceae bacterium]|nr:FHA domain-containing serine/threonine-protein kinase [Ktedonobacteraceae bacterium]
MSDRMQNAHRYVGNVYLIGQVIKTGQQLSSYTAYNRNTNDVVGLYVLELPSGMPQQAAQQLLQPLLRRRALQSPHILRVHDYGLDGTRIYIATDPPRGITLQQVMDNENVDTRRALAMLKQLATGLQVFHGQGIAGLDLRPQLITVDTVGIDDRMQIDDIGLRVLLNALGYIDKQRDDDPGLLDPRYAPPEYIQGGQVGPASDVYQLGLLLFTLITGRAPFVGQNQAATGVMQTSSPVPRMSQFNHETPPALQEIVERALMKDPALRYPNAGAMLAALQQVQLPPSPVQRQAAQQQSGKMPTLTATNEMQQLDTGFIKSLADNAELLQAARSEKAAAEAEIYAYLSYEQGGKELQRLVMTQKSVVVGRSDPKRDFTPDIDLSQLDPKKTVSRQHARIRFEETFFYIEDLKSRNKTRVGELPLDSLKPALLKHGDIVHFGSVRVRFGIPGMGALPDIEK